MISNLFRAFERMYLALSNIDCPPEMDEVTFASFSLSNKVQYDSFCDDFGPMNLGAIFRFCKALEAQLEASEGRLLVLSTDCSRSAMTNAVLLLGAYMILKLDKTPDSISGTFGNITPTLSSYRDISPGVQNFEIALDDCWQALYNAKRLKWIHAGPEGFDLEEYEHYDDPRNADLHVVIPNKIIAMKGPRTIPDGGTWRDTPESSRDFSPKHYAEILVDFDVQLVVRLNEPNYSSEEFLKRDIAVADLNFPDCTIPPDDVVVKFLLILELLPGAAAVHCKTGLGRTGTLIALYLMKNFAFTARQAIAWLRIVRPGSVIGRQQQYLCEMEPRMARLRRHRLSGAHAMGTATLSLGGYGGAAAVQELVSRVIARVHEGEQRRRALAPSPAQAE